MDRRPLAGQPDERDDREPAGGGDVEEVLAVGVAGAALVLGREPAVEREQRLEPLGDRVGVVDQPLGVAGEGGERGRAHAATGRPRASGYSGSVRAESPRGARPHPWTSTGGAAISGVSRRGACVIPAADHGRPHRGAAGGRARSAASQLRRSPTSRARLPPAVVLGLAHRGRRRPRAHADAGHPGAAVLPARVRHLAELDDVARHELPGELVGADADHRQARRRARQEAHAGDVARALRARVARRRAGAGTSRRWSPSARCRAPARRSSRSPSGSSATSSRPSKVGVAIGTVSSVFGIGGGVGLVLSGVIVEHLGWHWLFLVGAVPALVAAALIARFVPESPVKTPAKPDYLGAAALSRRLRRAAARAQRGRRLGLDVARRARAARRLRARAAGPGSAIERRVGGPARRPADARCAAGWRRRTRDAAARLLPDRVLRARPGLRADAPEPAATASARRRPRPGCCCCPSPRR